MIADDSASGLARAISPRASVSAKGALGAMVKTAGCFTPPASCGSPTCRRECGEGGFRLVARLRRADMNPGPIQHGAEQGPGSDGAIPHDVGGEGAGGGAPETGGGGGQRRRVSVSTALPLWRP